jgi:peptidoglycan/xylan/chitin deacetylase (PgdA/CDA1 family)
LFHSTHPVLIFDHYRIPCSVTAGRDTTRAELRLEDADEPFLVWPRLHGREVQGALRGAFVLQGTPIFGQLATDDTVASLVRPQAGSCEVIAPIEDWAGIAVAHVLRDAHGCTYLPFDPNQVVETFLSEAYLQHLPGGGARSVVRTAARVYYAVRPLLPRSMQIGLRRRYTRIQSRCDFPRWPIEPALHDFMSFFLDLLGQSAPEPVPSIAPWPSGFDWAIVLTHDVETASGYQRLDVLRQVEETLGYRSSWNLVARRYRVEDAKVAELSAAGHEIGIHGLYHDGRDLGSADKIRARLPGMREAAARWGAVGFRSPATQRVWEWMPQLGFDYDSSYPDTDVYEPQPGGCCSWLPFFNGDLVELPITLPQDHTLFVILQQRDPQAWLEKVSFLRDRGGMALLITHPDYLGNEDGARLYETFLRSLSADTRLWRALPGEVAAWWRRRRDSQLQRAGEAWTIVGPATDEAEVTYIGKSLKRGGHRALAV